MKYLFPLCALLLPFATSLQAEEFGSKAPPADAPCVSEYRELQQKVNEEYRKEESHLLEGLGHVSEHILHETLKEEVVHHAVMHLLESESWEMIIGLRAAVNEINVSVSRLYDEIRILHPEKILLSKKSFHFYLKKEIDGLNREVTETVFYAAAGIKDQVALRTLKPRLNPSLKIAAHAALPVGVDEISFLLFKKIAPGTWSIPTLWAARLTTLFWSQLITVPLSASRVPPEMEWIKAVENHPNLLLAPQQMQGLHILQNGENYKDVYCMAFQRRPHHMKELENKLIENMKHRYEFEVMDALFSEESSRFNLNKVDHLAVKNTHFAIQILPSWAILD